jgi:hypothetical protein
MSRLKIILFFLLTSVSFLFTGCSNDRIPTIEIITNKPITKDKKKSCTIAYSEPWEDTYLNAKIKRRGGISMKYQKHSYTLELKNKYSFGDLPADDDWILNANFIDKTFMRHKISYDLFRQMNDRNLAPECAYVNVVIDGKYQGLYVLMQEVNARLARLVKGDSYAMMFKDPAIFYEERITAVQDTANYYQQKYPKIEKADKTIYLEKFKDFLYSSDDQEFVDHISEWIDIENVMDWHLLLLFTNNQDGLRKNFYLYKRDKDTPFKFAIWDYDHSFGRDGDNEPNMAERLVKIENSVLLKRLMEIPESDYSNALRNRWFELRKEGIFSRENIEKHIQDNDKIISSDVVQNFKKWPADIAWYYDDNNYQQELDWMLTFVDIRIAQLDEYFIGQ